MLVVKSAMSNSYEVVVDNYGKRFGTGDDAFTFYPLPIARVPVGFGRTDDQAKTLAHWIADAIESRLPDEAGGEAGWAAFHGIRLKHERGTEPTSQQG